MSFFSSKTHTEAEKQQIKSNALDVLAKNVDYDNLQFLAEIAIKPNVNTKLRNNKLLVKSFL